MPIYMIANNTVHNTQDNHADQVLHKKTTSAHHSESFSLHTEQNSHHRGANDLEHKLPVDQHRRWLQPVSSDPRDHSTHPARAVKQLPTVTTH